MIPQHSHPHVCDLLERIQRFINARNDIYEFMLNLSEGMQAGVYKTDNLIDLGFLCREIASMSNDLRIEVESRQRIAEYKIAFDLTSRVVQGEDIKDPYPAELASGSPGMKMEAVRPKPGSPENEAFLRFLGIDAAVAAKSGKVLHADWKALGNLVSEMTARGQKLPPGLGDTHPVYFTTFRRKSGLRLSETEAKPNPSIPRKK